MNARTKMPASETFVEFAPNPELEAEGALARMLDKPSAPVPVPGLPAAAIATLHGFDLEDRPLVRGIAALAGEIVAARSTIPLRSESRGSPVVLVFENGDPRMPIILGVVAASPLVQSGPTAGVQPLGVRIDDASDRLVLRAEREVVLECGDASITLTRAGKVVIRGSHILSQASGYNRIKGAAIDIN